MTINDNIATSTARKAVGKLEHKLNASSNKVGLSGSDIILMIEALRDLDQKTSGIDRLPDGRTKFGLFTGGRPSIVLEQHDAARASFKKKNYEKALTHSVNAIRAYEDSKKLEGCISTGRFTNHAVAKLYYLAALSAQRLRRRQFAYWYAENSVKAESNAKNTALLSTTLANLGEIKEATHYIQKAIRQDPLNVKYRKLRRQYSRIEG